jgi:collagen type III alpha
MIKNRESALLKAVGAVLRSFADRVEQRLQAVELKRGAMGEPGPQGPPGPAGPEGPAGADGLSVENLFVEQDSERSFRIVFQRGTTRREFPVKMACVLDQGVFQAERSYEKGDGVSYGGSFWIAQNDTKDAKPGDGSGAWRLAVKQGRDGKQGPAGPSGKDGAPGKDGRNMNQRW